MKKHLFVLLACLFVVMIGFGITLPVLPFYVERLALAAGASQQLIVLHVTLLTGVYALMQLVFAPLWGRWSDRIGRRPLILIGIAGYVIAQVMFGLSTTLWLLYAARIAGGILSSATLPVSAGIGPHPTLPALGRSSQDGLDGLALPRLERREAEAFPKRSIQNHHIGPEAEGERVPALATRRPGSRVHANRVASTSGCVSRKVIARRAAMSTRNQLLFLGDSTASSVNSSGASEPTK